MTKNLIILAGGASSRMKKSEDPTLSSEAVAQANTRSKALILVNDRPMLDYLLYNAKQAGFTHIVIVISPNGALFKSYYGKADADNRFHGVTISYATQHIPNDRKKPLGTADAVLQALEQYPNLQEESFVVCNCDNLYSTEAFYALRKNIHRNALINYNRSALEYPMERIARFALTQVDNNNLLKDVIEKPSPKEIEGYRGADGNFRVSMNIFKFDGSLFYEYLKNCPLHPERKEKELPTALLKMVREHPKAVYTIPMAEHVPDLTGKDDISSMNDYLSHHFSGLDWNKQPQYL